MMQFTVHIVLSLPEAMDRAVFAALLPAIEINICFSVERRIELITAIRVSAWKISAP